MAADAVELAHAKKAAEEAADRAAGEFSLADRPQVTVTAINESSGQELINATKSADLLVLGSRGQRGFPLLRVSEIANKDTHYAECPVVFVPPAR